MSAKSKNGTSHLRRHLETDGCKKKRQQGPISPAADSAAGPSPAGDGDQQQEAVDEDDDDAFVASICACYDKLLADDLVDVVKRNGMYYIYISVSVCLSSFCISLINLHAFKYLYILILPLFIDLTYLYYSLN